MPKKQKKTKTKQKQQQQQQQQNSQQIFSANQMIGFYMMATLAFNELTWMTRRVKGDYKTFANEFF